MIAWSSWDRRLVGLIGIVVALAVGAGVVAFSAVSLGTRTYTVELEHTAGLRVSEEVQVAGVSAGEVTGITLGEDAVSVRFTLDRRYHLGRDTTAEVKVATLLGTHFLLVTPSAEGELDDATIPMRQTRVAYNLQDVLNDVAPELDELDGRLLAEAFDTLSDALGPSREELRPALEGVRDLSSTIAARSDQVGRLLSASEQVAGQLAASSGDLVGLMRQSTLILDELRGRREVIDALLTDTRRLATQLEGTLEDVGADTGPLLRDLQTAIRVLRRHDASLTRAVDGLAVASRYFANAAGTGPWLDQFLESGIPDNLGCLDPRAGGC